MQSAQPLHVRVTVALVGTVVAAVLGAGALATSHAGDDGLAGRKLSNFAKGDGGGKPIRL